METGYMSQLQALPEPLRSQMLNGDFNAGLGDDPWQVIPTEWVVAAQNRWTPEGRSAKMDSIGIDGARGGPDRTTFAPRHGNWFDEILAYPGAKTPDGPTVAGLVVPLVRDDCVLNVGLIGVGTSIYDHLQGLGTLRVSAINEAEGVDTMDRTEKLKFRNVRAEMWWRMRENLDPQYGENVCLPPDSELKADLCAPRWKLTIGGILIESKEDLKKRIGRSTDKGDATCMTNYVPQTLLSHMDLSRVFRK
uniref:Putative terminase n=1 Tax=viral metagenome TaxID=1070528 RepID=A0A6M3Y589_9ZZZZ